MLFDKNTLFRSHLKNATRDNSFKKIPVLHYTKNPMRWLLITNTQVSFNKNTGQPLP